MITATVIQAFLRTGPDGIERELHPGQTFECARHEFTKWAALGFVRGYETKVEPPAKVQKKRPSASSRPARPARKKTAKRSKKSATKR